MPFPPVELRAHTAFSFGDGALTPEALIRRAAELGYGAIGITDTADVGGIVRAALTAKDQGIRIIAGAELCVDGHPAAFLARDPAGYRNLAALVTESRVGIWKTWEKAHAGMLRGQPNVTWAQVMQHSEGLHALTGPASGACATLIRADQRDRADRQLAEWKEVFGERLAVEVHLHHVDGHEAVLAAELIRLAGRGRVPWVAAQAKGVIFLVEGNGEYWRRESIFWMSPREWSKSSQHHAEHQCNEPTHRWPR